MKPINVYQSLYSQFGPQHWWPIAYSKTPTEKKLEIIIGAILTQNTSWKNVEKALKKLADKNLLALPALRNIHATIFKKAIQPTGYYNQKAKKIKIFTEHIFSHHQGDLNAFLKQPLAKLREELLSLWGIGPETADSIILYAAEKPSFVIDAYTKRLCKQYGIEFATYDEYQRFFESQLPKSAKLYNEFHALIVAWGKVGSRKRS